MKELLFEKVAVEFRQDYLNLNHMVAISAEGTIFKVGDEVGHDGSEDGEMAVITHFSVDHKSWDVIAHTSKGWGRISFMYHPE
jgi:hypothetical protein